LFGTAARDHYGLTTFTIRLIPALFGLGTIGLDLHVARRSGTLHAVGGFAVGCFHQARFISRVTSSTKRSLSFFTLGIVVFGLRFYDTAQSDLVVVGECFRCAYCLRRKRPAIISVGVLVIAFALTHVYRRLFRLKRSRHRPARPAEPVGRRKAPSEDFSTISALLTSRFSGAIAIVVFLFLNILVYSSFFKYSQGVYDALKTFQIWRKDRANGARASAVHVCPVVDSTGGPLLFLGAIGAVLVVLKPKNSLALFSALWAFGLIAAYSLIPYKTPWLR
jgi:hypothetical protein